jgi:tetratricopeptide (TPR) repeat protein
VLAPFPNGDPSLAEPLKEALDSVLAQAGLPEPYVIRIAPLVSFIPTASTLNYRLPDDDLLITWAGGDDEAIQAYVIVASQPPLVQVQSTLHPWPVIAPEHQPIEIEGTADLPFIAQMAAAALHLQAGQSERAASHIAAMRLALSSDPQIASGEQMILAFFEGQVRAFNDPLFSLRRYSDALRAQPDFVAALIARGNTYLALGDTAAALIDYDAALTIQPGRVEALYNRTLAYQASDQFDAALADAQYLSDTQPGAAWTVNVIGYLYFADGDLAQALGAFREAASLAPDQPVPLFNAAITQYRQQDFAGALTTYEALLDLEPNNPVYHLQRALTFQAADRPAQAERSFNRAIDLDPGYLDAYLNRARFRLQQARYDDALVDAESILALSPNEAQAYEIIGSARLGLEDWTGAIEACTQALEMGYVSAGLYETRGWSWHSQRYIPYAIQDYEAALRLGSSDPIVLYRLGFALLEAGRYEDALEALLGAVNQGIDTPESHAVLAVALDANRRREDADASFRRALDLDPRYADPEYLATQPMWSRASVQRAAAIVDRLSIED